MWIQALAMGFVLSIVRAALLSPCHESHSTLHMSNKTVQGNFQEGLRARGGMEVDSQGEAHVLILIREAHSFFQDVLQLFPPIDTHNPVSPFAAPWTPSLSREMVQGSL